MIHIETVGGGRGEATVTLDQLKAMKLPALYKAVCSMKPGYTRTFDVDGYGKVRVRRMH